MSQFCRWAAFASVLLSAGWVRADGMLYQLPDDGAWAVYAYNASAKTTGGDRDDTMRFKGTLTLASVGRVVVQDEPCRWIEIQMTADTGTPSDKRTEVYKILVPEKFLAKGQSPLDHVVQAWIQRGNEPPQKLRDPGDINVGPLPIILSGPWKNVQKLDAIAMNGKLGKLQCEGTTGTLEFKMGEIGNIRCSLQNRLHEKSPFGTVTCDWTLELPEMQRKKAVMNWSMALLDVGTGAVSKLPNVK